MHFDERPTSTQQTLLNWLSLFGICKVWHSFDLFYTLKYLCNYRQHNTLYDAQTERLTTDGHVFK